MAREERWPQRQSMRLRGRDYAQPGSYFVTICTNEKACLFGEIIGGEMRLNAVGRLLEDVWCELPARFPGLAVDGFVVMPNTCTGSSFWALARARG